MESQKVLVTNINFRTIGSGIRLVDLARLGLFRPIPFGRVPGTNELSGFEQSPVRWANTKRLWERIAVGKVPEAELLCEEVTAFHLGALSVAHTFGVDIEAIAAVLSALAEDRNPSAVATDHAVADFVRHHEKFVDEPGQDDVRETYWVLSVTHTLKECVTKKLENAGYLRQLLLRSEDYIHGKLRDDSFPWVPKVIAGYSGMVVFETDEDRGSEQRLVAEYANLEVLVAKTLQEWIPEVWSRALASYAELDGTKDSEVAEAMHELWLAMCHRYDERSRHALAAHPLHSGLYHDIRSVFQMEAVEKPLLEEIGRKKEYIDARIAEKRDRRAELREEALFRHSRWLNRMIALDVPVTLVALYWGITQLLDWWRG